jgi:hypothetical protein
MRWVYGPCSGVYADGGCPKPPEVGPKKSSEEAAPSTALSDDFEALVDVCCTRVQARRSARVSQWRLMNDCGDIQGQWLKLSRSKRRKLVRPLPTCNGSMILMSQMA